MTDILQKSTALPENLLVERMIRQSTNVVQHHVGSHAAGRGLVIHRLIWEQTESGTRDFASGIVINNLPTAYAVILAISACPCNELIRSVHERAVKPEIVSCVLLIEDDVKEWGKRGMVIGIEPNLHRTDVGK